jgi:transposase-like protein
LAQLAQQFDVHPEADPEWKRQLQEREPGVYATSAPSRSGTSGRTAELNALHVKIGQLTVECDFLTGALGKAGRLSESDD